MICSGISPSIYSTRRRSGALKPLIADVDLIVIDNISTLVRTGCENESDSWRPVQEWGLQQRRAGRAVLFVHHTNKSGAQRGTSSREDLLDTVISLSRPLDYESGDGARFVLTFEKARGFYGSDADPLEVRYGTDDSTEVRHRPVIDVGAEETELIAKWLLRIRLIKGRKPYRALEY